MTGKRYYITTLGSWRAHASRFANSHFILLDAPHAAINATEKADAIAKVLDCARGEGNCSPSRAPGDSASHTPDDAAPILVLIEANEGAHLALEDEPAFEGLPHPLAQKPISAAAQSALAAHGLAPGATTFDATEAVARVHPLLRHRVF